MSESTDRVLIAGGGIAGLATAAALGRHDTPSVVLERRDQALDAGLGINLPGNAVMALGALGLGDGLGLLGARSGDTANERASPVVAEMPMADERTDPHNGCEGGPEGASDDTRIRLTRLAAGRTDVVRGATTCREGVPHWSRGRP